MRLDRVSLNTLDGRVVCRLLLGARQQAMLVDPVSEVGGANLVWRQGMYYLHITQSHEASPEQEGDGGTWGADLGGTNLAIDSEGEHFTGAQVQLVRKRYHTRRQRLQQVGSKNAKRRLRKNAGRERRCPKDVNHCISKALVHIAAISCKAIALEDLTGIRE